VIAQVKKEKKAERRQIGKLAYDLMAADTATRSKTLDRALSYQFKKKAATLSEKKFRAEQKQALFDTTFKWIGSLPDRAQAVASGAYAKLLAGQFMKGVDVSDANLGDMEKATGLFISKVTSDMHKTNPLAWAEMQGFKVIGEDDWAMKTLIDSDGFEKTYRVNKVAGKHPVYNQTGQPVQNADGTPKLKYYRAFEYQEVLDKGGKRVSGGPADPDWKTTIIGKGERYFNRLVNQNPFITTEDYTDPKGKVYLAGETIPAGGAVREFPGDQGRARSQMGTLYVMTKKGPMVMSGLSAEDISKTYGAIITKNERQDYNTRALEVVGASRLADGILELLNENTRATQLTSSGIGGAVPVGMQTLQNFMEGFTGKPFELFEKAVGGLGVFRKIDADVGGLNVTNGSTLLASGKKITESYVNGLEYTVIGSADGSERRLSPDEFSALQGLTTLNLGLRAKVWKMAYAVAKVSEPGGRLTDRDFANALVQMGVNTNGNFDPVSFKAILNDLAYDAQQSLVDQANTLNPNLKMTTADIFGPKGQYPDSPLFERGAVLKVIKSQEGQPQEGQPPDPTWLLKTFSGLVGKTGMVKGVETPIISPDGRVNSEALTDRRRLAQQALGGGQIINAEERAALTAEIERLDALTNIVLKQ
tara:strand:- start:32 stop:1972 length:1941 start_codon:yes stop_codon:yes gene_type:complete